MQIDAKHALARLIGRVYQVRKASWDEVAGRARLTLHEAVELVVTDGDYWPFVGVAALGAKARRQGGGGTLASADNQHRL